MMVEVDVEDDRDLRSQRLETPVGLVSLGHEPPLPGAGIRPELGNLAPDDPRGIAPGLAQRVGDHRRGRRLAVGAGDDDRRAQRDELREELRSRSAGDARVGAGDHDLPPAGHLRLRGDANLDARLAHGRQVGGLVPVPPPHLRTPGVGEQAVRRQPGTADPDEPDPAAVKRSS